ncbi:hypothetical protein IAR55_004034 [Kwoniella newhampshirensis]|uniref:Mini-chromosome maintenance complex-binding protein n=1 Tax=Kwoniella newhampshirensis TaxID=1651941 RepID=A0AAW0YW88_9TREE
MSSFDDIVKIALKEHEDSARSDTATFLRDIKAQLEDPASIPCYSKTSPPLSLVSFNCLLQDTGYPLEVYLPGDMEATDIVDWAKLKERWIGWGVEIPGEQDWVKEGDLTSSLDGLSLNLRELPASVYDDNAYRPASTHKFLGVLSTSPMPSNEPENADIVPTIHVLAEVDQPPIAGPSKEDGDVREELVEYLATAFDPPDRLAAEYVLLLLLSSPTSRPSSLSPLGTLAINLMRESGATTSALHPVIASVSPRVIPLALTLPLLHTHRFSPASADSSSLEAGLLQLGEGTVLIVDEDGMGSGGQLNEKAIGNLRALSDCLTEQRVKYDYPYMDGLKMDCAVRVLVLSQGKTLLPVDVNLPVRENGAKTTTRPSLEPFRSYLARHSASTHAALLVIPEETGQLIQDDFVTRRKNGSSEPEETLKRRMKIARLLALSYPHATLTKEVWERAVRLDEEVAKRHTLP